jgi:arylsulfatase A-like enzyme
VNRKGGFGRGFDTFDESCLDQPASCLNTGFLRFLDERRPERFFAYLHYMEPHHPYAPPRTYVRRFAHRTDAPRWVLAGNPDPIEKAFSSGKPSPATAEDLQTLVDLYDDEIAYWDAELQQLFDELDRRQLRQNTLVVFAADHGEMFLEHGDGDIKHCRRLWDTVTHVPLVLWVPGTRGRRVPTAVQNLDILPTILDYLATGQEGWQAEGLSLRRLADGARDPRRAFSVQGSLRSVNDDRLKAIRDVSSGQVQLFDLVDDPGEHTDLAPGHPDALGVLGAALDAWIATSDRANTATGGRAGRDVEAALRALGYLK